MHPALSQLKSSNLVFTMADMVECPATDPGTHVGASTRSCLEQMTVRQPEGRVGQGTDVVWLYGLSFRGLPLTPTFDPNRGLDQAQPEKRKPNSLRSLHEIVGWL